MITGRPTITTTISGRITTPGATNTVDPIITGIWNDISTWSEVGKLWNDSGDTPGLIIPVLTGRPTITTSISGRIIPT